MATIKDVAEAAQVSIGTVSKYINGIHIREKNRASIERAIEALGYRINPTAQALKTNRTRSVAIMLPSITSAYSPRIISQIEATLSEFGYTVMIMDTHGDHELEGRKIEMMLDRRVDGFVVFPIDQDGRNYRRILDSGVPMCLVDTRMSDLPCVQVLSENAGATRAATEMLLDEGHTHIGIITGNAENATAMERLQGYREALLQRGLDVQKSLIELTADFSEKSGYQSAMRLMRGKDRPTAILACNYYTTLGATCALMDLGLEFGREIRMVGFDYERLPRIARRPMGIIAQAIQQIGEAAAQSLLKQMNGEANAEVIRIPTQYAEWTMETILQTR